MIDGHEKTCADCGTEIGKDSGPSDGWQLEDGRTVCHECSAEDLGAWAESIKAERQKTVH